MVQTYHCVHQACPMAVWRYEILAPISHGGTSHRTTPCRDHECLFFLAIWLNVALVGSHTVLEYVYGVSTLVVSACPVNDIR